MDTWAAKTKKQNQLNSKVRQFQDTIKLTEQRANSGSSLHALAGHLYSSRKSRQITPKKSRPSSAFSQKIKNQSKMINPEINASLTMRVSHIPTLSEMNTELLIEKKELQTEINQLRNAIAMQKNKLHIATQNCSRNKNQIQKYSSLLSQNRRKSENLQSEIDITTDDCNTLKKKNNNLNAEVKKKEQSIDKEQKTCQNFKKFCKDLKVDGLTEDKNRIKVKDSLTIAQKNMKSSCTQYKELENERAFLLLSINQSVSSNKI